MLYDNLSYMIIDNSKKQSSNCNIWKFYLLIFFNKNKIIKNNYIYLMI